MLEVTCLNVHDNRTIGIKGEDYYGTALYFRLDMDENPVMQFTGLHDSDEREIYEGDILNSKIGYVYVVFNLGSFSVAYPDGTATSLYYFLFNQYRHTVIGNIYENPELLERNNQ